LTFNDSGWRRRYTISSAEAVKIVGQIEPRIVIPMHYAVPKLKMEVDDVSKFLKAMGKPSVAAQDKLTIRLQPCQKKAWR
jgi:L-ascorbate metabolism protein UlaG (beta-lactamase superfamily)